MNREKLEKERKRLLAGFSVQTITAADLVDVLDAILDESTDDDWIPWHGGGCPVDGDHDIDWKIRDGSVYHEGRAGDRRWRHIGYHTDIIAYRISPPTAESDASVEQNSEHVAKCDHHESTKSVSTITPEAVVEALRWEERSYEHWPNMEGRPHVLAAAVRGLSKRIVTDLMDTAEWYHWRSVARAVMEASND